MKSDRITDCIFCKIVEGSIPAKKLIETDHAIAFADLHPQASFHALIVPKKHFSSLNALDKKARADIFPALFDLADQLALEQGFREQGYRTVINNQADSGQTVFHLHVHILAKSKLRGSFGA